MEMGMQLLVMMCISIVWGAFMVEARPGSEVGSLYDASRATQTSRHLVAHTSGYSGSSATTDVGDGNGNDNAGDANANGNVYIVGGQEGWSNFDMSTFRVPNYSLWAASHSFYPGDQFIFEFTPKWHSVYQFQNKTCYERCDFKCATMLNSIGAGSIMWQATDAGTFYFGCNTGIEGFGTHCTGGQKVAITIISPAASPP